MQSIKQSVKAVTSEAADTAKDVIGKVGEVQGIHQTGQEIVASYTGNTYRVKPCPLSKIPELVGYIKKLEAHMNKNIAPTEILTAEDGIVLKQMAEVIRLGIMRDNQSKTIEQIMDEFTLGDFPKIYKLVLDINDFLAGMRNIYLTESPEK